MTAEEDALGYRGEVLNAIRNAGAQIGDIIRVTRKGKTYEGTLIPRSEYGDEMHVVIKLRNGYNMGVRVTSETQVEKVGKGSKPSFVAPALPQQQPSLPRVAILSTGGTIASRVDYRTGGVRAALNANDLYSVVPELAEIARIDAQILLSLFSENIRCEHWVEIAHAVAREIAKGLDGVTIAHGTDTMGYTAAALSFALQDLPVPVILVGSQRSADRPSSDAATNLVGAVTASARAPFAEVAVAMHETTSDTGIVIHRGTKVRKCHTSRRDAFRSVNTTPIARIKERGVEMLVSEYRKRDLARKLALKANFNENVALVKFYPGMNPNILTWYAERGCKAIVLEGTGLGHVAAYLSENLRKVIDQDILVAMTSQCIWGRTNMNVYDTGRDLQAMGIIPLDDMLPETAVVKLMWIFGQTKNGEEARRLLKTNIAGEISKRTPIDDRDAETGS